MPMKFSHLVCGIWQFSVCILSVNSPNWFYVSCFKVRGIETLTRYDASTGEFVINTPCESAQKYWIGGAANVRYRILKE